MVTNGPAGRRAVFLDRDGVLVVPEFRDGRSFAPRTFEAFRIYDDAPEALARLKEAGFLLVVVTNQPDVGHGLISLDTIGRMHRKLKEFLPVDRIELCTHTQREGCTCRKPMPGMLLNAADALAIDLSASIMVGDRASDVEAGRAAGCRTIFIDLDYANEPKPSADWIARSVSDAANIILTEDRERELR